MTSRYTSRLRRLETALPTRGGEARLAPLQLTDLVYLAEAEEKSIETGDPDIARAFRIKLRRKLRRRYAEGFREYANAPDNDFVHEMYAIRDGLAASEADDLREHGRPPVAQEAASAPAKRVRKATR